MRGGNGGTSCLIYARLPALRRPLGPGHCLEASVYTPARSRIPIGLVAFAVFASASVPRAISDERRDSDDWTPSPNYILIEAGDYPIGIDRDEWERYMNQRHAPRLYSDSKSGAAPAAKHVRRIEAFYMYAHEVSVDDYALYIEETGKRAPEFHQWSAGEEALIAFLSGWNGSSPPIHLSGWPMIGLTPEESQEYCHWLSMREGVLHRLPTAPEWEAAYRGKEGRLFPWGDAWDDRFRISIGRGELEGPIRRFGDRYDKHNEDRTPDGVFNMFGSSREYVSSGDRWELRGLHYTEQWGVRVACCQPTGGMWYERGFRFVVPLSDGRPIPYDKDPPTE